MSTLSSSISTRASGLVRASNSRGRRRFSTSRTVRYSGGPLFNLGGLGASREAQYLSREHGIPRSEYSANIHLIRSSEVDPFAPAPGSTRTAAARAAARAQAETHSQSCSQVASGPSPDARVAPDLAAHGGLAALAAQLQAVKDELAEAKRALRRAQAKGGKAETPMTSHLLSTAIVLAVIFFIGKDVTERVTAPPSPADGLVQAQTIAHEVDAAAAQRRSDAPAEEQALAESGLTSFQVQPSVSESHPRSSVLSGLFWART